jgi:NADPH:quinone reductase-like Zn-dependent oxidoreductase
MKNKENQMKAVIWTNYGPPDVLQLREVSKPVPKDDEVLVKVYATTVTAGDNELRSLKGPKLLMLLMRFYVGLREPKRITVLGQELAGEIESVGKGVTRFRKGDPVFAWTGLRLGAYAEYTCLPEDGLLAIKPSNMTYEEAATLPVGGLEAVHLIRKANLHSGEKVLINGAGGCIGTFAVQLARYYGAEVTAVDSKGKLEMLRSIGADQVMDYTQEDFAKSGETYDVIYDVIGKSSFSRSVSALKQNGRYLLGNPGVFQRIRGSWASLSDGKKVLLWEADRNPEDIIFLIQLIEAGKVKSVIDQRFPIEQVAEAHRYVETGQKKGNVVIVV